jgi:hypothetical protein
MKKIPSKYSMDLVNKYMKDANQRRFDSSWNPVTELAKVIDFALDEQVKACDKAALNALLDIAWDFCDVTRAIYNSRLEKCDNENI